MNAQRSTLLPREALKLPSLFMHGASRERLSIPRHIALIEEYVIDAIRSGDVLLTIEAPVRHGKSFYLDWHLPAWYLGSMPTRNVGVATYEHRFAASWGQRARDTTIEFGASFGVAVDAQVRSRDWWEIAGHGGSMRSMGIGGAITGKGFNLLIIDDPIKNAEQANSAVYRDAHWEWLRSTALTRLEPGGVCILTMARWHEDDLIGRAHREMPGEWRHLRLPALAEPDDPMGRPEGEPLWPERYDDANLERRKSRVGSYWFSSLYQQAPSPPSGRIFQRDWWRRYVVPPGHFDDMAWSFDLAFKGNDDSDFVVGQLWGRVGADFYLLRQVRGRMDYPTTKAMIRREAASAAMNGSVGSVYIEDTANGPAVIADLKHEVPSLIAVKTTGDSKLGRATSITGLVEAGNVYLPEQAEWVEDFIEETAQFPVGRNDDQVDAMSQALREMRKRVGATVWVPTGDVG